jgi:hypothetical protein
MDLVGGYADNRPWTDLSKSEGVKTTRDAYTISAMQFFDLGIEPAATDIAVEKLIQVCYTGKVWTRHFGQRVQMTTVYDDANEPDGGSRGQVARPGQGPDDGKLIGIAVNDDE